MAGIYDIASSVENHCSDNGDQLHQETQISDRMYQQQDGQNALHQMDNQTSSNERPTEIPAAKVCIN